MADLNVELQATGLFWKKFGTKPKRTRGLEEMQHCANCNFENGLWFDEFERVYDDDADQQAFERWLDTACKECGITSRSLGAK